MRHEGCDATPHRQAVDLRAADPEVPGYRTGLDGQQPLDAIGAHHRDEPAGAVKAEAAQPEDPLRPGELGLHRRQRFDGAGPSAPAVQVPPATAVRGEDEAAIGSPGGSDHRLVRATRDQLRGGHRAIGRQRAHPQLGAIPGHLGSVPRQPAQSLPRGVDARIAEEVVALGEGGDRAISQRHRHHRVARLAVVEAVVLQHRQHASAGAFDAQVGEAQLVALGERPGRLGRSVLPVEATVREVGEHDHARVDRPRPAAVLVGTGAHVETSRCHVRHAAIRRAPHDDDATSLAGPALEEVQVLAIEPRLRKPAASGDDHLEADGRGPRSIRGDACR